MKISHANNPLAKYSQTISELVIQSRSRPKPSPYFKKLRPLAHFSAWPSCPKRHISALSGYTLAPHLDLKPVEQFLKRHALMRTEPLLRTSPLLSHAANQCDALEKAVAIKRMASLMHETLLAMKSLTQIQATHHRG